MVIIVSIYNYFSESHHPGSKGSVGKEDLSGPDNPPPDPESPPRIGPNEKQATDGNIVSIIHFTGIYAESEEIVRKEDCNGPDNSHPGPSRSNPRPDGIFIAC